MKIVASTKLTRAQRTMEESRRYGQTSQRVFEEAETKPTEAQEEKTLLVVCSSDKGLCGGIHSSLTRAARRLMENTPGDYDIVVLGEKCKAQLSRSDPKKLALTFAGVGKDVPTFADAQAIADQISMLPTDYKTIKIMYNSFVNAQSYNAVTIDAYDEETIMSSREKSFRPRQTRVFANIFFQHNLPSSRSTTKSSPISKNTPSPTTCTGLSRKATHANNPRAATPWTMPPRTPAR